MKIGDWAWDLTWTRTKRAVRISYISLGKTLVVEPINHNLIDSTGIRSPFSLRKMTENEIIMYRLEN